MHRALAAVMLATLACAAQDPSAEITYLLDYVAASGCTFHRNGEDHAAVDAAEHLRLKYHRGQRYADSAEAFIDRLASASSWSGKPYTITCQGVTEPSGAWLHRALDEHRTAVPAP